MESVAPAGKNRADGFTLVEMLVLIAIIAVLAALMMPALNNAIHSARRISCANKLRQISLCFEHYFSDYNDLMPRAYAGNAYGWAGANFADLAGVAPAGWVYWYMRPLNKYIPDKQLLVCPDDNRRGAVTTYEPNKYSNAFGEYGTSYRYRSRTVTALPGAQNNFANGLTKRTRCTTPSRMMYLCDGSLYNVGSSRLFTWHSDMPWQDNGLFLDGHVDFVTLENCNYNNNHELDGIWR